MSATMDEPGTVRPYPVAPRVLAGTGALAVAVYFGYLLPLTYLQEALPWTAATLVVTAIPFVAFLGLLAGSPEALQKLLDRWTALDLRDGAHVAVAVIMAGTLYLIIGLGSLFSGVLSVETVLTKPGGEATLSQIDGNALFVGLIQSVILLTLPSILYVGVVHGRGPQDTLRRLGLHRENLERALGEGVVATLAVFALLIIAGLLLQTADVTPDENDRALAIARSITILGAVGISIGAAVGEEIFFRGFLQPRIGIIGQALVFGLAHLNYVNVSEVVVTTALALLFGVLYKRTGNLMAPMVTHFLFNLIMLVAAIVTPTQ